MRAWAISVPAPIPVVVGLMARCPKMVGSTVFCKFKNTVWPAYFMHSTTAEAN